MCQPFAHLILEILMKNYVQDGDTITLPAPYAVTSGQGALIGALFGVANNTAASGDDCEFDVEGVFDITALSTDTATVGAKLYWDNTNKRLTTTASGNTLVGVAVAAKAASATTARIRLGIVA